MRQVSWFIKLFNLHKQTFQTSSYDVLDNVRRRNNDYNSVCSIRISRNLIYCAITISGVIKHQRTEKSSKNSFIQC